MMCKAPRETLPGMYVSCGRCLFCRINKARIWQSRILLEAMVTAKNAFVTLTYDDDHLPKDGSVSPEHLRLFMKRLRRYCEPERVRFYGVGEYGDDNGRPHYHLALFGVGTEIGWCKERKNNCVFSENRVVEKAWNDGMVHVGKVEKDSARYITQYVTKFMNFEKSKKLKGRHKEFARMSNRPGIGAPAMRLIAANLIHAGYNIRQVVGELNYNGGTLPLDRYLQNYLHELRGGDVSGKDDKVRDWLADIGVKYSDYSGQFSISVNNPYSDHGLVGNCSTESERVSIYSFLLRESKAKRWSVEKNPRWKERRRNL